MTKKQPLHKTQRPFWDESAVGGRQLTMQHFFAPAARAKTLAVVSKSNESTLLSSLNRNISRKRLISHSNRNNSSNEQREGVIVCSKETEKSCIRDNTVSENKENSHRNHNKALRQTYIDAGQRDFAKQHLCPVCGMLFVDGLDEDKKEHDRICHLFVRGVPFQATAHLRVAASWGTNASILEVRPTDPPNLRSKVAQVCTIVDKELGFSRSSKTKSLVTTFLYVLDRRVVGFASAELIDRAFELQTNFERSRIRRKAIVGIHQIWVHSLFRHRGIATALLDSIREKMVFGFTIPSNLLAFSSPTESGAAFARAYASENGDTSVLVYDCHE